MTLFSLCSRTLDTKLDLEDKANHDLSNDGHRCLRLFHSFSTQWKKRFAENMSLTKLCFSGYLLRKCDLKGFLLISRFLAGLDTVLRTMTGTEVTSNSVQPKWKRRDSRSLIWSFLKLKTTCADVPRHDHCVMTGPRGHPWTIAWNLMVSWSGVGHIHFTRTLVREKLQSWWHIIHDNFHERLLFLFGWGRHLKPFFIRQRRPAADFCLHMQNADVLLVVYLRIPSLPKTI